MLLHKLLNDFNYTVTLASQSPRRRELLSGCGIEFRTVSYEVEEHYPTDLAAEDVPLYLAQLKSHAYPHDLAEREILITADTVVILGDRVLGKPTDATEAREMLSALSGSEHSVVTGVALRSDYDERGFAATSSVRFAQLSAEQIEYYIERYAPFDKAGSYGIQEWIGYIGIEGIEGSFYNVMGLPIQRLYSELGEFIAKK